MFYRIGAYLILFMNLVHSLSYDEVIKKVSNDGLLRLSNKTWRNYLKNEDYGFFLLLTAVDSRVGCTLCQEFDPEYKSVAEAYWESLKESSLDDISDDKSKIVFGYADFLEVKEMFQLYEIQHVPRMYYYEPGQGPKLLSPSEEYKFLTETDTEHFQQWIVSNTPSLNINRLKLTEKINSANKVIQILGFFIIMFACYKRSDLLIKVIGSKRLWTALSLFLVVLFISGHMFNQIRGSPYKRHDQKGNAVYFQQGQSTQLGAETQIVSIIYVMLMGGLITMIQYVPTLKNSKFAMWIVICCCVSSMFAYSGLINAYSLKSFSYPLRLFKLF